MTEGTKLSVSAMLDAQIHAGELGRDAAGLDSLLVTLRESHVAWASYERPL